MIEKLQKLGLSKKEAQIYLELAKLGEASANEIAKQTSTQRTVSYNILQQLVEKGMVSYIKKSSKRIYHIINPNSLVSIIKEKEIIATSLAKEISELKRHIPSNYNVEVYEGLKGMKILFEEIKHAKDLRVINATGKIFEYLVYSAHNIVKEIEKIGNAKVIGVASMKKTELAKSKKIKIKYLPENAENIATTFIFNNIVIIQVLRDKPFLIKISNKEIFEGYSKDFDVLWGKL